MICQDGVDRNYWITDDIVDKFVNRIDGIKASKNAIIEIIYDLYKIGLDSGQEFTWKLRSGDFDTTTTNPNLTEVHYEWKNDCLGASGDSPDKL